MVRNALAALLAFLSCASVLRPSPAVAMSGELEPDADLIFTSLLLIAANDGAGVRLHWGTGGPQTAFLISKFGPSGIAAVPLAPTQAHYSDPAPDPWSCYRLFSFIDQVPHVASHTLCYARLPTQYPNRLIRLAFGPSADGHFAASLINSQQLNGSGIPFALVVLPLSGGAPRVEPFPAPVPGRAALDLDVGTSPTCFFVAGLVDNTPTALSDMVCGVPNTGGA